MFVHGGWLHIIFNMLFLWIFGNNVEDTMGRFKFLVFYLVCGLAAAGLQVAIDVNSTAPTIGASGAIAGVLGAYIVLFPRARVLSVVPIFFFLPILYVPAWIMLGIWFGLQLIQGYASIGGQTDVAFFAHIGGFVAGLLLVWVFTTRNGRSLRPIAKPRARAVLMGWDDAAIARDALRARAPSRSAPPAPWPTTTSTPAGRTARARSRR